MEMKKNPISFLFFFLLLLVLGGCASEEERLEVDRIRERNTTRITESNMTGRDYLPPTALTPEKVVLELASNVTVLWAENPALFNPIMEGEELVLRHGVEILLEQITLSMDRAALAGVNLLFQHLNASRDAIYVQMTYVFSPTHMDILWQGSVANSNPNSALG